MYTVHIGGLWPKILWGTSRKRRIKNCFEKFLKLWKFLIKIIKKLSKNYQKKLTIILSRKYRKIKKICGKNLKILKNIKTFQAKLVKKLFENLKINFYKT